MQLLFAPVAQWIGRQPPELKIAGSNPAGRTTNNFSRLYPTSPIIFGLNKINTQQAEV